MGHGAFLVTRSLGRRRLSGDIQPPIIVSTHSLLLSPNTHVWPSRCMKHRWDIIYPFLSPIPYCHFSIESIDAPVWLVVAVATMVLSWWCVGGGGGGGDGGGVWVGVCVCGCVWVIVWVRRGSWEDLTDDSWWWWDGRPTLISSSQSTGAPLAVIGRTTWALDAQSERETPPCAPQLCPPRAYCENIIIASPG